MLLITTFIGTFAATITTLAFIPQVWQVYKTKKTNDISLTMYIVFCVGVFCWILYGILLQQWPIIIANAVTFVLAMYIVMEKIKN